MLTMTTVFTMIMNGDIAGTFVWRDDQCVAFMSINPIARGHALVVPIEEVDHWVDLDPDLSAHLFDVAARLGRAQQSAFSAERIGLIVAGFEVPHCHIHVIPTQTEADLSFSNAAASVDSGELEATAAQLRTALRAADESGVTA